MISPSMFRMRKIATATLLISLLILVPGWYLGYHAPLSYVTFWLLNTLLLLNVWMLFDAFFPSDRLHDACIRIAVLTFAIVALCGLVLGSAKRLTPGAYAALLLLLMFVLASLTWRRHNRRRASISARHRLSASVVRFHPVVVLIPPILVCVLCFGWTHPPVGYDSLTYHLFFPARWLQAHQLAIIPTPFGDQAPAYAPSNGELFYLWLMLPFHGDLLARVGQFPAYVLCAITIYGLARKLGASAEHALYAGGLFLLSRPVIDQAAGADVDLVFAATFLAAVYFGLTASETGERSDIVLWGVSVGLCLGTKYLGVTYAPLLLVFMVARPIRWRAVWALPGIAALAAPWYIRNWIVAGSPLYPVSLSFAGLTIAPGAWTRGVSINNWAHLTDLRLLPGLVQDGAFGKDLFFAWLPFALLGTAVLLRSRRWIPLALAIVLPAVMCAIYWYVLPFNDATDTRYLFPAVGLAMLLAPPAFRVHERLRPYLHVAFCAALVWLIGLSGQPLLTRRYVLVYAALAGLLVIFWRALSRSVATVVLTAGAACVATFLVSVQICPGAGCPLVTVSTFDRPTLFAGWAWIEQHAAHVNIAYSGNNIPYRLLGPHLENAVSYVNIDRHLDWRYHDYQRAARARPGYRPPQRPNPPYFRQHGNFDAWLENLTRRDIGYVFLTSLSVLMEDDYERDEAGFPIEVSWADAHPQTFTRVYDNPEVRIYSVRR